MSKESLKQLQTRAQVEETIRLERDLSGADLSGLDLSGIKLAALNMEGVNLSGSKLEKGLIVITALAGIILGILGIGAAAVGGLFG